MSFWTGNGRNNFPPAALARFPGSGIRLRKPATSQVSRISVILRYQNLGSWILSFSKRGKSAACCFDASEHACRATCGWKGARTATSRLLARKRYKIGTKFRSRRVHTLSSKQISCRDERFRILIYHLHVSKVQNTSHLPQTILETDIY